MAGKKITHKTKKASLSGRQAPARKVHHAAKSKSRRGNAKKKNTRSFSVTEFQTVEHELIFAGFLLMVSLISLGFSERVWDWAFAKVLAAGI